MCVLLSISDIGRKECDMCIPIAMYVGEMFDGNSCVQDIMKSFRNWLYIFYRYVQAKEE